MKWPVELLVLLLWVVCVGCGTGPAKVSDEMPTVISDLERVRGSYTPPADGVLTKELVEEFVVLLERARRLVVLKGGEKYLNPRYVGKNKRRLDKRRMYVRQGIERAQLELGMVSEKYLWLDKTIKEAFIARATPSPSILDKGIASYRALEPFWERYEKARAGME